MRKDARRAWIEPRRPMSAPVTSHARQVAAQFSGRGFWSLLRSTSGVRHNTLARRIGLLLTMASDYDASRRSEEEQKEESLEALRLAAADKDTNSGRIDEG